MKSRGPDLFNWTPPTRFDPYGGPGYKEHTTSKAAAKKVAPRAPGLRAQALDALRKGWPAGLTPDEIAAATGKTEFAIRPRITELKELRAIEKMTVKGIVQVRPNASGANATVWVAKKSFGEW